MCNLAVFAVSNPDGGALDYLQKGGVLGLLVGVIIGYLKKWWAPAWYVKAVEQERDEWKALALDGTRIAERSSSVLEEAIKRGKNR